MCGLSCLPCLDGELGPAEDILRVKSGLREKAKALASALLGKLTEHLGCLPGINRRYPIFFLVDAMQLFCQIRGKQKECLST